MSKSRRMVFWLLAGAAIIVVAIAACYFTYTQVISPAPITDAAIESPNSNADADEDGYSDADERALNTEPYDPTRFPSSHKTVMIADTDIPAYTFLREENFKHLEVRTRGEVPDSAIPAVNKGDVYGSFSIRDIQEGDVIVDGMIFRMPPLRSYRESDAWTHVDDYVFDFEHDSQNPDAYLFHISNRWEAFDAIGYTDSNGTKRYSNVSEILKAYSAALNLAPLRQDIFLARAMSLRRVDRIRDAASDYSKAIRLNPNDSYALHAYMGRATIYEELRMPVEAAQDWAEVRSLVLKMVADQKKEKRYRAD